MRHPLFWISVIAITICLTIFTYQDFILQWWNLVTHNAVLSEETRNARIRRCYLLGDGHWLDFSIPKNVNLIRVLTNAEIHNNEFIPHVQGPWNYGIRYQVTDAEGKMILREGEYHHRTKLTPFKDTVNNRHTAATFYPDSDIRPTDGRYMQIDPADFKNSSPGKVRLSLGSADSDITGVVACLYVREEFKEANDLRAWSHLSKKERARLAKGNVFPHDLLTSSEKLNLLKKKWRPVAPSGAPGRNYSVKRMYVRRDVEPVPEIGAAAYLTGFYLGKDRRFTVPLPPEGAKLEFEFEKGEEDHGRITVAWYGHKLGMRESYDLKWQGIPLTHCRRFGPGIAELSSNFSVRVKVKAISPPEGYDPASIGKLRTYTTHNGLGVSFGIEHSKNGGPALFKAEFRRLILKQTDSPHIRVTYILVNGKHKKIRSGTIDTITEKSLYDFPSQGIEPLWISEPVIRYFRFTSDVCEIRFFSEQAVLVSGYSRPATLVKTVRIPQDILNYPDRKEKKEPVWFPVRPLGFKSILSENRSMLISVQQRPPRWNPYIEAGRYAWEGFRPSGSWMGRYLLTPVLSSHVIKRETAMGVRFRMLLPGKTESLDIRSHIRSNEIMPKLVILAKNTDVPVTLQLISDGRLYYKNTLHVFNGIIKLPYIGVGPHKITLQVQPDADLYISNVLDQPDCIMRFACILDRQGLTFNIPPQKGEARQLSIIYFSPYGYTKTSAIKLTLASRQAGYPLNFPLDQMAVSNRRYIITPASGPPAPVINTEGEAADAGQMIIFPMDRFTAASNCRFTATLKEGPPGYILVCRINPGDYDKGFIFYEGELRY